MKTTTHGPRRAESGREGFALIVTVSLMVLLVVLAVGALGLSSISLRRAAQGQAMAGAQANARLALSLAIGDLQRFSGPDTRVTAMADILDPANPPLTGVWRSWEGDNHQQSGPLAGRPVPPPYSQKQQAQSDGGRFVSWLVSSRNPATDPLQAGTLVRRSPSPTSVPLVADGTLAADDDRQVHIEPLDVGEGGRYAWWVSGENQKALSPKPYDEANPSIARWADRNRSHSVADPEPFGMDAVLAQPALGGKAFSRGTADLIADGAAGAATPTESFHDLSALSTGLLTNVATGGWRKDFSLLTENWDAQPTSGLEFFQISPTAHLQYTRPANNTDYRPPNSMIYHWADYRPSTLREFWARRGPIASWAKIKSYATLYKKMSSASTSAPNINHQSWVDNGTAENAHETFHNVRILPQMARLQIVVSHYATTSGAAPGRYRPAVLYTPYVTVWNPYNTRVTMNGRLIFSASYTWPLALNHKLSGTSLPDEYWAVQAGGVSGDYGVKRLSKAGGWFHDMVFYLNQNPMVLEPGETRIFSPAEGYLRDETGTNRISTNLTPGVRSGVGYFFTLDRRFDLNNPADPLKISFAGATVMDVDAKFDVASRNYLGNPVCGSAYQWFIDSFGSGRSHSWYQIFYRPNDAEALYPPRLGLASASLAQCAESPVPFLSMTLGSRIANFRAIATKGVVQADPVVDFFSSNGEPRFTDIYPGNDSLINTPWDFSVVEHAPAGDDMSPNVDNTTNSSYIVSGVRKADGVSRIVAAELPTRPLASLADLTHMPIRGLNPTPPYSGNVVGNSDATPLIPKDNIVNPANPRANSRNNEQQDDSYCANHVLFDDWFFSSIAPEPADFGPAGGTDLRQTYIDLLTDKDALLNRAYRPILEDQVADATGADAKYTQHVQPVDSWKTIASRLEVEGMFNVNSTSVKAWRALLGHARNQQIPYSRPGGAIALSDPADYAFSRTSVAGDREAGEAPQVAGEYADTTQFTGYRVVTDEMLDFLAEQIVGQVRKRGPFLSLSEFVNRQLSNDNELALAGAIQAALNQLAADSSLNPFQTIQNESVASLADPPGPDGYLFREAAVGFNTYGLPGWTRQADILRRLAPILSARDDTFTIRAYGESRSADGTTLARAWCEAVVRRTRDFNDPGDAADITTRPLSPVNLAFGRKYEIISFRWLSDGEI